MKTFLAVLSFIVGLVFGVMVGGLLFSMIRTPGGDSLMAIGAVIPMFICAIIFSVLFVLISRGSFGSEHWRINRYIICIILPLLIIVGLRVGLWYFTHVVVLDNHKTRCLSLAPSSERDECFYNLAYSYRKDGLKSKQDIEEICYMISNSQRESDCFYYLVANVNNIK